MIKIITPQKQINKLRKESERQIQRTLKSWRKHKSRKSKFNFEKQNLITGFTNISKFQLDQNEAKRIKRLLLKSIALQEKREAIALSNTQNNQS